MLALVGALAFLIICAYLAHPLDWAQIRVLRARCNCWIYSWSCFDGSRYCVEQRGLWAADLKSANNRLAAAEASFTGRMSHE